MTHFGIRLVALKKIGDGIESVGRTVIEKNRAFASLAMIVMRRPCENIAITVPIDVPR
ncbi:hypothetical protein D3C86_2115530 [compost metagenome]